jgi:hypothetical protein
MSAIRGYDQLMEALNALRRQWRQRKLFEGVLQTVAGVLGLLVVAAALDNLLKGGPAVRLLLALGFWGGTLAMAIPWVIRRVLEDRRDDFFAALAEEKNPVLRNRLINALQLGRGDQRGHSPVLIEAIVQDATAATADLELRKSIDPEPLKRGALCLSAALLVLGAYATVLPERFENGVRRVMLPFADVPPYTLTRIPDANVTPGNVRVPEGDSVTFEVRVEGEIPRTANLHRRLGNGDWKEIPMQADPARPDTFRVEVGPVLEGFPYYVTAGDGRSKEFTVEAVKRPRVESYSITYAFPAYTGLEANSLTGDRGEIVALPGTAVTVEIRASKPLKEARLCFDQGHGSGLVPAQDKEPAHLPLRRGADDRTWATTFVLGAKGAKLGNPAYPIVEADDRYEVRVQDTDGIDALDRTRWELRARADAAPKVEIIRPKLEVQPVKPTDKLPVAVRAADDFGVGPVKLHYRFLNRGEDDRPHELAAFPHDGPPQTEPAADLFTWDLAKAGLRGGDQIQLWAAVEDRNTVTGPGRTESGKRFLIVIPDAMLRENLKEAVGDYALALEKIIRVQTDNRTQTSLLRPDDEVPDRKPAKLFPGRIAQQEEVRRLTDSLAREIERDGLKLKTMVADLDALRVGLMADAVSLFEQGRDSAAAAKAEQFRDRAVVVQDQIIAKLMEMLKRLQRNEQAKKALERLLKTDKLAAEKATEVLKEMLKNVDQHLKDATELASKFERLPKKPLEEFIKDPEGLKAVKDYDEFKKRTQKWTKESVNEMTKLPEGYVKDFDARKDANRIFEEIEAKARGKAEKLDVALEDLGAGLGTKMKEDLEMWLPDAPDSTKWVQEEPLNQKGLKVPEMPLPKALEDMIGELLQKADEFDEDADDVTSAWGDNLDQAGWGVSDGPISSFSAKGKTGNDQPNSQEVTGRSGDGRRGKSTGQMVGDTARGLPGRKTPARVGNEKYEPGALKQEGSQDPNGATGGGKKAGAGRIGLQGGTAPDISKDVGRLNEKQQGLREKAEQVARKLEEKGYSTVRLRDAINLMKPLDADGRDLRYEDLAKHRREALQKLRSSFGDVDATAETINRAKDLPPELRKELLQGHDEGYPPGYENLLKNYYKKLSGEEK